MPDFNVRSDSVNVEQIMEQIRSRIREKRGTDYTEQQIRELAAVKLEKFLDPKSVRSDLLEAYRQSQATHTPPAPPNYAFGEETLFETHRGPLRAIRRLLSPILKMFWNPNPLIQALHIQAELNTINAQRETGRRGLDQLHFEVLHNLVLETTRMGIEIKNLKMKVESLTGRLEFNERRARALESAVVYQPAAEERIERVALAPPPPRSVPPMPPPRAAVQQPATPSGSAGVPAPQSGPEGPGTPGEGPGQRSRRRRRRRGRRGGGSAVSIMGGQPAGAQPAPGDYPPEASDGDGEEERDEAGAPAPEPSVSFEPSQPPVDASAPPTVDDPSDGEQ
jgi:hypothetical protein